ncbi:MAG: phosphoribosylaminoimidazolesuccinocarboxamide synthase [Nitrospinota bacterium]
MSADKQTPDKGEKIYEGKAKSVFATSDPGLYIQSFKDDASAFNGIKKGTIVEKGVMNSAVSSAVFAMLEENGVKTHLVKKLSDRDQLIKKVEIIPVEVVVRNIVAGSLAKRMGRPEGEKLKSTIIEFYYKDDELGDPMINEDHIGVFGLATESEMAVIKKSAMTVNELLVKMFKDIGLDLVDFKLEYGRHEGEVILADEISMDTCRLWDTKTGEKMDKDRFRFDLGKVEEAYREVTERILKK